MASSIVASAAQQLGTLVAGEAKYLYDVRDKIERLQRDLQYMLCFLEDADNRQHKERVVAMWVSEIRDFAYEAEEIVEKYVCEVSHHRQNGMWNTIKWFSCVSCDALALHDVGSDIDSLRSRINELISRMQMFGIQYITSQSGTSAHDVAMREERRTYSHIEEDPVGLKEDINKVVHTLVSNNEVKVVGISGMGGLGKTTLARKVFQNDVVRKYFKNNLVWVYISKEFERKDIFQEILIGLTNTNKDEEYMRKNEEQPYRRERILMKKIKELPDGDLPIEICKILREKTCIVVLDDIWRNADWDTLKPAFEGIVSSGSKILITTRDHGLVQHADKNGYPHTLNFLSEEDSWKLLQRTAFPERESREKKETTGSQDLTRKNSAAEEMVTDDDAKAKEKLGREMLKHCKGLPLAIIALGGLLSTKKRIAEWENVQRNITCYLMSDLVEGSEYRGLSAVLELSFYDLPVYLKPCFMYLGIFPEDYQVSAERLYHLWEAEGLVSASSNGRDIVQPMALDDIAESYLNQLVKRSVVQVEKHWSNGRIKSCRLHDVMRDLCLKKCEEVNFLNIIEHGSLDQDPSNQSTFNKKLRRCAINLRGPSPVLVDPSLNDNPCIRSLLVFPCGEDKVGNLLSEKTRKFLSLIRVLDLEQTRLDGFRMEIGGFIHLRYLSLKGVLIDYVPSSIWDCKYIETLDLRCPCLYGEWRWSNKFCKLERLRHLYLPPVLKLWEFKKSLVFKTNQLHQMETFKNFNVGACDIEDLRKMRNLRVFSMGKQVWLSREDVQVLFKSPVITSKRLVNPLRLSIDAQVLNEDPTILTTTVSDLSIDEIRIKGWIQVALVFPDSLTRVRLEECKIGEEGIRALEKLPRLEKLHLEYATGVSKMRFFNGGFTQLCRLTLVNLHTLEELEVEKGALPNLQYLEIRWCERLKMKGLPRSVQVYRYP